MLRLKDEINGNIYLNISIIMYDKEPRACSKAQREGPRLFIIHNSGKI